MTEPEGVSINEKGEVVVPLSVENQFLKEELFAKDDQIRHLKILNTALINSLNALKEQVESEYTDKVDPESTASEGYSG